MTFASAKFKSFLPAAIFILIASYGTPISASILCGNLIGESALAAANLMQGVFEVVNFFERLFAVGTCVLYANELGAFHIRRARGYFTIGLISTVITSLVLMAVFAALRQPVLQAFAAAPEVTYHASRFWIGFLPNIALAPLSFYLCSLCCTDGDVRLAMLSCGARLVSTWAFSYPLTLAWGATGSALGLFAGQIIQIAVLCCHFRNPKSMFGFSRHFVVRDIFRIFKVSMGDACLCIGKATLLFMLNAYVLAKFGASRLAVLAVVVTVISLVDIVDSLGNSIQPLISVYIAEGNCLLIRRIMRLVCKIATGVGLIGALILMTWPQVALVICGVKDPIVIAESLVAVRLVSGFVFGVTFVYLFSSYYVYISREGMSLLLAIVSGFMVPMVMIPLCGSWLGLKGVWIGFAVSPFIGLLITMVYIAWREGAKFVPLLLPIDRDAKLKVFDLALSPKAICDASVAVESHLVAEGVNSLRASKASLLVEEALMSVYDRNEGHPVIAEVTVDLNDAGLKLVLRDDGEIFDITDADNKISSLRSYLVSNLMMAIPNRRNLTATGFNRNVFKL